MSGFTLTSPRALMVKEDPVDSKHVVSFSEVHHNPVGIKLSSSWEKKNRRRALHLKPPLNNFHFAAQLHNLSKV